MMTQNRLRYTYDGYVSSTLDAILVFEAVRRGILGKTQRRLSVGDRALVRSGQVFVFDEGESRIKRWTDGLQWSPSRIVGNFLVYRQVDKGNARQGNTSARNSFDSASFPHHRDDMRLNQASLRRAASLDGGVENTALLGTMRLALDVVRGGMCKKTISMEVNGRRQHLISYFTVDDVRSGRLCRPSSSPYFLSMPVSPDHFKTTCTRTSSLDDMYRELYALQPGFRKETKNPFLPESTLDGTDNVRSEDKATEVLTGSSALSEWIDQYTGFPFCHSLDSAQIDQSSFTRAGLLAKEKNGLTTGTAFGLDLGSQYATVRAERSQQMESPPEQTTPCGIIAYPTGRSYQEPILDTSWHAPSMGARNFTIIPSLPTTARNASPQRHDQDKRCSSALPLTFPTSVDAPYQQKCAVSYARRPSSVNAEHVALPVQWLSSMHPVASLGTEAAAPFHGTTNSFDAMGNGCDPLAHGPYL